MAELDTQASKPISCSRTVWFNVAAAVLPLLVDNVLLVRDYLPDWAYLLYMCLVSIGNVYFRSITSMPVTLKKPVQS